MAKKDDKNSLLESFAVFSQMGFMLATPVVLCVLLGIWLDKKAGTNMIFFILFLVLGIVGGVTAVYKQVMAEVRKGKKTGEKRNKT